MAGTVSALLPEGPLLWYVNRSTGIVLLVLLTVTVLLGVLSTHGEAGTRLPRFVMQSVHRHVGLLTLVMLGLHIATAVLDEYVDIRWWQAFAPLDLHYEPVWLGLGVLAGDLLLAVVLTSVVRHRLEHRSWRLLHLFTYPAWVFSVAHGLGIGTDQATGWARWTYVGCAGAVAVAVVLRLLAHAYRRGRGDAASRPSPSLRSVGGPR